MSIEKIKAVVMDVDGVLTDGRIYYDETGNEWKGFNVRDGLIIKRMGRMGYRFGAVTGRSSLLVERRMAELEVGFLIQKCMNKKSGLLKFASDYNIALKHIAYIGDDLIDISAMELAGLSACPGDAVEEVRNRSHLVLNAQGGAGALRELGEMILKAQGRWREFMDTFNTPSK